MNRGKRGRCTYVEIKVDWKRYEKLRKGTCSAEHPRDKNKEKKITKYKNKWNGM